MPAPKLTVALAKEYDDLCNTCEVNPANSPEIAGAGWTRRFTSPPSNGQIDQGAEVTVANALYLRTNPRTPGGAMLPGAVLKVMEVKKFRHAFGMAAGAAAKYHYVPAPLASAS